MVERHRRVVQEHLPRPGDVHDQLLLLAGERPRRTLRQVDRDPLLEDRRRHHEDDEQHQHHVDQRRDVDLRDRVAAAAPAGHGRMPSPHLRKCRSAMLRNSDEKLSISAEQHAHLPREVVVRDHGRESPRRARPRWRSAPRRCPARPPGCSTRSCVDSPRKAFMMPQTVPNRPTNGAVAGGGREEGERPARACVTSCVRRAVHRALDVLDAAEVGLVVAARLRFARVRRTSSW